MLLEGNLGPLAIDLTVSQQMNPEFLKVLPNLVFSSRSTAYIKRSLSNILYK